MLSLSPSLPAPSPRLSSAGSTGIRGRAAPAALERRNRWENTNPSPPSREQPRPHPAAALALQTEPHRPWPAAAHAEPFASPPAPQSSLCAGQAVGSAGTQAGAALGSPKPPGSAPLPVPWAGGARGARDVGFGVPPPPQALPRSISLLLLSRPSRTPQTPGKTPFPALP